MTPKKRIFKKEYAKELLKLARNDYHAGHELSASKIVRKETALLMFQQAMEKALKATICHLGSPVPLVHDLYALMQLVGDDLPEKFFAFDELTNYATVKRYEEGRFELTKEEVQDIDAGTLELLDWCQLKIGD